MKYYNLNEVPNNTNVWACAYSTSENEKTMSLRKEPVLGQIQGEGYLYNKRFFELKRNGQVKASGGVLASSRIYADTYEECVEMYNELIDNQIRLLQRLMDRCIKDRIELTGSTRRDG